MIGFYTGLRISEAFALTWNDIDLEKCIITVSKQVVKRNFGSDMSKAMETHGKKELKSSWYFTSTKTPSSERTIPFGETLYKALKAAHIAQKKNELKYSEFYTIHVLKKELDDTSTDSFKYCSRVIHKELMLAFDYHSSRHPRNDSD